MSFGFPELAAIRFGFGLSPLMPPPVEVDEIIAGIAEAAPGPNEARTNDARLIMVRMRKLRQALSEARVTGKGAQPATDAQMAYELELRETIWRAAGERIARAVDARVGFGERLVQFWADHFTIIVDSADRWPLYDSFIDQTIRKHVGGKFEDMLFAAESHPSMLLYLNQNNSIGPNSPFQRRRKEKKLGLNENLAREILELHTVGVKSGYNQTDVRQLAELLTGLSFVIHEEQSFRPERAEPGAETVLGKSYGGDKPSIDDIRAVMVDLARNPATAEYISRKLAVHFLSDNPPESVVAAMAATWKKTQGDLPQVYRVMLSDPAVADTFRQKARQPFDYVASGLRAIGITGDQIRGWDQPHVESICRAPMRDMGQPWGKPLGPNGWAEEAEAWITPQALSARINWSLKIPTFIYKELNQQLPDPRALVETVFAGTQSDALMWAIPKAESQREGVALVLASNDFNRR